MRRSSLVRGMIVCIGLTSSGLTAASPAGAEPAHEPEPTQAAAPTADIRVGWNQLVDLATSPIPTVLSHIMLREELTPSPTRQLGAVYRLTDVGLLVCLERLTRSQGSEELVEAIERLDEGTAKGEHDRLREAVWKIWRERGVESWLDATLEAGEPTEAVIGAIGDCIAPPRLVPGTPAPRIDAAITEERRFRLAERSGRFVVVAFWASWCKPCLPEIEQIAQRLHAWNGQQSDPARRVDFVAINSSEGPEQVEAITGRADLGSVTFAFDPTGAAMRDWGILVLPSTFLVDPNGRIAHAVMGEDLNLADRVIELVAP
jgi:thiol-disulfide isomerase/thioredoxin